MWVPGGILSRGGFLTRHDVINEKGGTAMADQAVQDVIEDLASATASSGATKRGPTVPPFDYVIFGGTGDLTFRKLLPSLYSTFRDGLVEPSSRIIGASRAAMSTEAYRAAYWKL